MKIVLICFLFLGNTFANAFAKDIVDTYSNGSSQGDSIQAEEEETYQKRPIENEQERMEQRRGWKGSSIEPANSPKLKTDNKYEPNRNIEGSSD